jgi:hypothetical protein
MGNRRRALVALALAGSAGVFATSATAAGPADPVGRACDALVGAVRNVVSGAATTQARTVTIHFYAPASGTLSGTLAFNATGSTIRVSADRPAAVQGGGCAEGSAFPGVPKGHGRSRIVSTVRRTFSRPGRHLVTFRLNGTGQKMLARLGAKDRAYRQRHPHGGTPPAIGFGVSLSYSPAG